MSKTSNTNSLNRIRPHGAAKMGRLD